MFLFFRDIEESVILGLRDLDPGSKSALLMLYFHNISQILSAFFSYLLITGLSVTYFLSKLFPSYIVDNTNLCGIFSLFIYLHFKDYPT